MTHDRDLSRRELLRGRFLGGLVQGAANLLADAADSDQPSSRSGKASSPAQSARYRKAFPVLRPPGAVDEELFLNGCTKCQACITACPHQAIVQAPLRFRRAAETPMIDPIQQPCWMCRDYPCIAACEPGVLRLELPKRMGIAQIEPFLCMAHQGGFCTVCSEQCPVDGAIELTNGKPTIVTDVCTGCGACQYACPAPMNAVLLMPVAERPVVALAPRESEAPSEEKLPNDRIE